MTPPRTTLSGRSSTPNGTNGPTLPACIGVFDSGLGGLSVVAALRQRLPRAPLLYIGDTAYAPYGERPVAQVIARCRTIVRYLEDRGASLIVVACNTATALAIDVMRDEWPDTPIVGVEPGVKPAVLATRNRRIALMVTPATATSERLQRLIERHAAGVECHVQACGGLAAAIEREPRGSEVLNNLLEAHCKAIRATGADTVALGCTHYPLVASSIQALLGEQVRMIDTAQAVAERAAGLWTGTASTSEAPESLQVFATGGIGPMQALIDRTDALRGAIVRSTNLA